MYRQQTLLCPKVCTDAYVIRHGERYFRLTPSQSCNEIMKMTEEVYNVDVHNAIDVLIYLTNVREELLLCLQVTWVTSLLGGRSPDTTVMRSKGRARWLCGLGATTNALRGWGRGCKRRLPRGPSTDSVP